MIDSAAISFIEIFPPLAVARLGNSEEGYRLAPQVPETSVAEHVTDSKGDLVRQAVQFRVYAFDKNNKVLGELNESTGFSLNWTAHVANAKAASRNKENELRNAAVQGENRKKLIVEDMKSVEGVNVTAGVPLTGSFTNSKDQTTDVYLGELRTDAQGRLIFLGGKGRSEYTLDPTGLPVLENDMDSDDWVDDTSDGSIKVVAKDASGKTFVPPYRAWVITAPPHAKAAEDNKTAPFISIDRIRLEYQPSLLARAALEETTGSSLLPEDLRTKPVDNVMPIRVSNEATPGEFSKLVEQPGDATKALSLPWQTTLYDCNTHWWPSVDENATKGITDDAAPGDLTSTHSLPWQMENFFCPGKPWWDVTLAQEQAPAPVISESAAPGDLTRTLPLPWQMNNLFCPGRPWWDATLAQEQTPAPIISETARPGDLTSTLPLPWQMDNLFCPGKPWWHPPVQEETLRVTEAVAPGDLTSRLSLPWQADNLMCPGKPWWSQSENNEIDVNLPESLVYACTREVPATTA